MYGHFLKKQEIKQVRSHRASIRTLRPLVGLRGRRTKWTRRCIQLIQLERYDHKDEIEQRFPCLESSKRYNVAPLGDQSLGNVVR